jgi:HSF-type DNA-binding
LETSVENVDSFQLLSKKLMLMMLHIERMAAITSGSGPKAAPLEWGKCRNNNRDIDTVIFNDPKTFVGKVLPAFGCPPTSFNSFVRKMYRWGFRRAQLDDGKANDSQPCERCAYACDHFRRGDFSLLTLMVSTDSRAKSAETQSTKPADTTSNSTETGHVHSKDNAVQKRPRKRRAKTRDSIVSRGPTVDVDAESIGGSPRDRGTDSCARANCNPMVDQETRSSTGPERRVTFAQGDLSFARPHKRFFNPPTCLLPPLPPGMINNHPSLADGIEQRHFQQSAARNFSFQSQLFPSHQNRSPLWANQLPVSSPNLSLPSSLRSHSMLTNGPWPVANVTQTADVLRSAVDLSLAAEHARRQQRIREGLLLLTAMREPAVSLIHRHSLEPTPKISEAAMMLRRPHHETRELSTGLINGLSEDQLEALLQAQQRRQDS